MDLASNLKEILVVLVKWRSVLFVDKLSDADHLSLGVSDWHT